jgi:amphi-Trp domain-containing protein
MSEKFKKKITLSRQDAAARMIAIGEALAASGQTTIELGDESTTASVPEELTFELEVKEAEMEIELKWERTPSAEPNDEATNESSFPHRDPGEQAATIPAPDRFAQ